MAGLAAPWVELNRAVEAFCADAAAHAAAPERWCTLERLCAVQALLEQGAALLAQPPAEAWAAERARYAVNLRQLKAAVQSLQGALESFAQRLEGSRQHLGAVRQWLDRHL